MGGRDLEVHFSPDDRWIIVQDGGPSLGVSLRLFQRVSGLNYKESKNGGIEVMAERAALKQNGVPVDPKDDLEHLYGRVLKWSPDSKSVLLNLSGQGIREQSRVSINQWFAVYNVETGALSFDLSGINAGAVVKTPK